MWPEGTGGYLGDELRPGHAQEVTQAVPLGSHDRELCIPGEEERGAASAAGTVRAAKPAKIFQLSLHFLSGVQKTQGTLD